MNRTIVITGANRGIGLAFCRHYQEQEDQVYAVCRQSSKALASLCVNVIEGIDVSVAADVLKLKASLSGIAIDILINNAGILQDERLGELDFESIQWQFEVNALGPLRVTETLKDNLSSGSKIAMITSRMGSITDNTSGGRYGYRMSKAALNIASMSLAKDLEANGVALAILHPGLVGTEMIGGHGDLTPEQAAGRLACRIEALNLSNTGTFWHSNGEILPW